MEIVDGLIIRNGEVVGVVYDDSYRMQSHYHPLTADISFHALHLPMSKFRLLKKVVYTYYEDIRPLGVVLPRYVVEMTARDIIKKLGPLAHDEYDPYLRASILYFVLIMNNCYVPIADLAKALDLDTRLLASKIISLSKKLDIDTKASMSVRSKVKELIRSYALSLQLDPACVKTALDIVDKIKMMPSRTPRIIAAAVLSAVSHNTEVFKKLKIRKKDIDAAINDLVKLNPDLASLLRSS